MEKTYSTATINTMYYDHNYAWVCWSMLFAKIQNIKPNIDDDDYTTIKKDK